MEIDRQTPNVLESSNERDFMTWNINQRSGLRDKIPEFVIDIIKNSKVAIITEFRRPQNTIDTFEQKLNTHWLCFSPAANNRNEIMIAVKKEFSKSRPLIEDNSNVAQGGELPNLLQICMTINNKPIRIIGVRIRISDGSVDDFSKRKLQLDNLMCIIREVGSKRLIVAGDFNNAGILGCEDESYHDVKKEYIKWYNDKKQEESERPRLVYNYHILKDCLQTVGLKLYTPKGEQYSWGFKFNNDTKEWDNGYIKNDHFAVSDDLTLEDMKYCKAFMIPNNGYDEKNVSTVIKNGFTTTEISPPLPDHAILMGKLTINK